MTDLQRLPVENPLKSFWEDVRSVDRDDARTETIHSAQVVFNSTAERHKAFQGGTKSPKRCTETEVEELLIRILFVEGPVVGTRLLDRFAAGYAGAFDAEAEKILMRALRRLVISGKVIESNPLKATNKKTRTYHLPGQSSTVVRKRGSRKFAEVTPEEIIWTISILPRGLDQSTLVGAVLKCWSMGNGAGNVEFVKRCLRHSNYPKSSRRSVNQTVDEQAEQIEQALDSLLIQRREFRQTGDSFLVADLGLGDHEFEQILKALKPVISRMSATKASYERALSKYPLLTLSSLVGVEARRTEKSFWNALVTELEVVNDELFVSAVRGVLLKLLRRKGLSVFQSHSLGAAKYVRIITLQSGFNLEMMEEIFSDLEEIRLEEGDTAVRDHLSPRLLRRYEQQGVETDLGLLSFVFPERAEKTIAEIIALYRLCRETSEGAVIDDQLGSLIPKSAFNYLSGRINGEASAFQATQGEEKAGKLEKPTVRLNVETLQLELVFPAGIPSSPEGITWTLTTEHESQVFNQEFDWSMGTTAELRIPIYENQREFRISTTGLEANYSVGNASSPDWIVLSSLGALLEKQDSLPKGNSFVLTREGTAIQGHGARATEFATEELGPLFGWDGWTIIRTNFQGLNRIDVKQGGKEFSLRSSKSKSPELILEDEIDELRGVNGQKVYRTIPTIVFPFDNNRWEFEVSGIDTSGNRIEYTERTLVEEFDKPVFLLNKGVDPWVGDFKLEIFRNSKSQMVRSFHLIEDFEATIDYNRPSSGSRFVFSEGNISEQRRRRCFVSFRSANRFYHFPIGAQSVFQNERNATFRIANSLYPDELQVDVIANPATLKVLYPWKDGTQESRVEFTEFSLENLSLVDDLKFNFPEAVYDVSLEISSRDPRINKRGSFASSRTIDLIKSGRSSIWKIHSSLLSAIDEELPEHLLTLRWSGTSDIEFARQHPDRGVRNELFKSIRNGEKLDRNDRFQSVIGLMHCPPLLKGACISGNQLNLELGRSAVGELECWIWSFRDPEGAPICFPVVGNTVTLNDEAYASSPIILDLRENAQFTPPPKRPSKRALILNGEKDTRHIRNWDDFLIPENDDRRDIRILQVWNSIDLMHQVLDNPARRESDPVIKVIRRNYNKALHQSPRLSLAQLDKSNIEPQQQIEHFVRTGLVARDLSSIDTSGQIHPVRWVGLMEELNDVVTLRSDVFSSRSQEDELEESRAYIVKNGSSELLAWSLGNPQSIRSSLNGGLSLKELIEVQRSRLDELQEESKDTALLSTEALHGGYAQLVANRSNLQRLHNLGETLRSAVRLQGLINKNLPQQVHGVIIDRTDEANRAVRNDQQDLWLYVPKISLTLALLARMQAHRVVEKDFIQPMIKTWALIAKHAPTLVAQDLVSAEAILLGMKETKY